jgi:hypothetical protein
MNTAEITRVERLIPDSDALLGFSLELPVPRTTSDDYFFEVGGWVLGASSPAIQIELIANDGSVRTIPIIYARADVESVYLSMARGTKVGFRAPVSVIGMTPEFELLIEARLENRQKISIGRILGRHRPVVSRFKPAILPLLVNSLGRMGTTWMMRLLSEHPAITVLRIHPYETRPGKYWMQLLAKAFWRHEPLWNEPLSRFGELDDDSAATDQEWFRTRFIEQVATSCQRSVEECYREIAESRNQQFPAYFAEKHIPDEVPGIFWELYSNAREIVIVRDFRDMLCSIRSFNAKRSSIGFNRDQVDTEEQYIYRLAQEAKRLLNSWKARHDRTCLVRYEDLISQPTETLQRILSYLELEASSSMVAGILQRALVDSAEMQAHRTSGSVQGSISRWRRDLDDDTKLLCEGVFGEALKEFGYALK